MSERAGSPNKGLTKVSDTEWHLAPQGAMHVPVVLYASEALIRDMDDKVLEQAANVAALPGIVGASYAMPDAHCRTPDIPSPTSGICSIIRVRIDK